jgi:hypothetical protein
MDTPIRAGDLAGAALAAQLADALAAAGSRMFAVAKNPQVSVTRRHYFVIVSQRETCHI